MVHLNNQPVNDEQHVAFGGEKHSGTGRFGGKWALDKFTTVKGSVWNANIGNILFDQEGDNA